MFSLYHTPAFLNRGYTKRFERVREKKWVIVEKATILFSILKTEK